MSDQTARTYSAFRLNLEQQRNRAKDLLRAAKAGDAAALRRLRTANPAHAEEPKLATAQHCVARELRFASWAALKRHIGDMERSRASLDADGIDGDCRTMHIRCGHDIGPTLREAGLHGVFNAHTNPYLQGPVRDSPEWLEERVRFIAESLGGYLEVDYAAVLEGCRNEERLLEAASRDYERVALWFEHDRYDQFALLRCLAAFAERGAPPRLELITANDFPGSTRFLGLGQLPPEALRLLWERRTPVDAAQIAYGANVWRAFRAADPTSLAALMRSGSPSLPNLARALERHLRELPSVERGLGYTQEILLRALSKHARQRAGRLVGLVMHDYDSLPGLGDIGYDVTLRELGDGPEPLVRRDGAHSKQEWHLDEVELTSAGHKVFAGERDWLDSAPTERWVGGVCVAPGRRNWRWDESRQGVVRT